MQVMSLNKFISALEKNMGIKICIHDISGILKGENLRIDYANRIHMSEFCRCAKSTQKGLKLCLECKKRANRKAVETQTAFWGMCSYGMSEVTYPVVVDYEVKCIIYLGNIITDSDRSIKRLNAACKVTKASADILKPLIKKGVHTVDIEQYTEIAKAIESYILLLHNEEKDTANHDINWAVHNICRYIDENYAENITLKACAEMYFINEKYFGIKFSKEIGMSFKKYLNFVRIENAKKMLKNTKKTITSVAFECGYADAAYFNRVFKQITLLTPSEYRENKTEFNRKR